MMLSMRSLLRTMTPTAAHRQSKTNDATTPDTVAESPEPADAGAAAAAAGALADATGDLSIPELYQLLDTQLRVNIGTSVKCGICLSTFSHRPARTPCGHAFCEDCIVASLVAAGGRRRVCPECQTPISSKRALQPASEHLTQLAKLYKQSLVEFGFVPSVYQPNFTTLTQKPLSEEDDDDDGDGDEEGEDKDKDKDKDAKDPLKARQQQLDRWHVAATWQTQALPHVSSTSTSKIHVQENNLVVDANQKACQTAGFVFGMTNGNGNDDGAGEQGERTPQAWPNTQEILDTAREQQVADDALDDNDDETARGSSEGSSRKVTFRDTVTPVVRRAALATESPVSNNVEVVTTVAASTTSGSPFDASFLSPIHKQASLSPMAEGNDHDDHDHDEDKDDQKNEPEEAHPHKPQAIATAARAAEKGIAPVDTSETEQVAEAATSNQLAEVPLGVKETAAGTEPSKNDPLTSWKAVDTTVALQKNDNDDSDNDNVADAPEQQLQHLQQPDDSTVETIDRDKPRPSGLVEDSFGALHWTHRASLTLSSTQEDDDDEELPMTLTMIYDDPSRDYAQLVRAELEAQENNPNAVEASANVAMAGTNAGDGEEKENDDHEDDSQETTVINGGRPSEQPGNARQEELSPESSDSTAAVDSDCDDGVPNEIPVENGASGGKDDRKPAAACADDATTSSVTKEQTTNASKAPRSTTRRRARSEPTPQAAAATIAAEEEEGDAGSNTGFSVGDIVTVQARTWSGINKPGGVARITKIHGNGSYNVAYILGGKESNVDSVFVSASETTGKRRRRETAEAALPTALLQALAAQGFDTTGRVTLENAAAARNPDPKTASKLKDISNESVSKTEINVSKKKKKKSISDDTRQKGAGRKRKSNENSAATSAESDAKQPQPAASEKAAKTKRSVSTDGRKTRTGRKSSENKSTDGAEPEKQQASPEETKKVTISSRKRKGSVGSKDASKKKGRLSASGESEAESKAPQLVPLSQTPAVSNEKVIQVADEHYKAHLEASLREKVLQVVASGLSKEDTDILKVLSFQTLAGNVKLKLSETFGKKTSLCVIPLGIDTSTGMNVTRMRTAKAMRASLAGIPIVSAAWVHACVEQNTAVLPTADMIARSLPTKTDAIISSGEANFGVARLAAQLAQKSPLPLHNHSIFFCGAFAANRRKDLQILAREAGAKILSDAAAVSTKLGKTRVVLLCSEVPTGTIIPAPLAKEVRTALQTDTSSVFIVHSQWIFESITCAKALSAKAFPPVNAKAKELWQLGNPQ